ncbi:Outer membrane lipoprotein carrier protein LolA [Roseibacterium elongatum DSM 19469]|uniref:Outer membrane lipoprotein carrier protein LolA n=2 Tax=Roseicyclus elongatus TaxID=159346 RepID=W8RQA5_9RHOB|nr:Outer membrane lipoprotein carrier protein LolA [Roseibacterium elongatum DSM 19469]
MADQIPLRELSRYLNAITTAEADFTQINDDGSVSTGHVYLRRPGNMRFEYADDDLLVMAGGQQVAIFDGRSNARPEQYPLRETPLSIILAAEVDLGRSDMVVSHAYDGTTTRVVAQDPDRPEIGSLTMVFTPDPTELRQWIVRDDTGAETTVILGALEQGAEIPLIQFNITHEIRRREGD